MYNNRFTKRYKNIPIARFSYMESDIASQVLFTVPEIHKEFEIILIKEGVAQLTINNRQIIAKSGDLVFINPYILHSLELPAQKRFSYTCFCFDLSLLSNPEFEKDLLSNSVGAAEIAEEYLPWSAKLRELFLEIDSAMDKSSPFRELSIRGNINLLFSFLVQKNFIKDTFNTSRDRDFCIKVFTFIESHFNESITSEEIAAELGYNQSYFCRLFKKNFSMRFGDFLSRYRLDRAKRMLEDVTLSITEVSHRAGFSDTSYFSKIFKAQNNITPKEYRNSVTKHL